ncbi:hypothetical protein DFH28DRAFT_1160888 [Melampsora americana]|nr:hypothetical protein DFH28DRAFT_1160888 [Melampsora americana]
MGPEYNKRLDRSGQLVSAKICDISGSKTSGVFNGICVAESLWVKVRGFSPNPYCQETPVETTHANQIVCHFPVPLVLPQKSVTFASTVAASLDNLGNTGPQRVLDFGTPSDVWAWRLAARGLTVIPQTTTSNLGALHPGLVNDLTAETLPDSTLKRTISEEGIEAHGLVTLSKYFTTKMIVMDGYVSLTVFNMQWLNQDLLQKAIWKRLVKEKLEDNYWDQLAVKFKAHQENVFAIKRENANWPIAFCYDLTVWTTVMTFRQSDSSIANPALRDVRLEQEAQRDMERTNDFLPAFKEINPYTVGEVKANIDPISGFNIKPNATFSHQFN